MNQKCQKKKMEEDAKKADSSEPAAAPAEPAAPAAPAAEPTAESAESITMPLVEEEPKKLVGSAPSPHPQLSMKAFITLGISAAVCDVFYAPCTAMGKDPSGVLSLSPYVLLASPPPTGRLPDRLARLRRRRLPLRLVAPPTSPHF